MSSSDSDRLCQAAELPFGLYAEIYDILYQDKNYAAEAAFVVELIRRFLPETPVKKRILDLACGTGRLAFELAGMGLDVAGGDVSDQMIAVARKSAAARNFTIPFHVESFQKCRNIGGTYHAALAMFASLGYLLTRNELTDALAGIRELLEPGGLFIFDVWNGLAVIQDYSPVRVKRAVGLRSNVIRISRTSIDAIEQISTVQFDFVVFRGSAEPIEFSETHLVRFFFPREIVEVLTESGFDILLRCPFLDAARPLAPRDWNATFVARKR
jgi:SAM-dependent methyltransferase